MKSSKKSYAITFCHKKPWKHFLPLTKVFSEKTRDPLLVQLSNWDNFRLISECIQLKNRKNIEKPENRSKLKFLLLKGFSYRFDSLMELNCRWRIDKCFPLFLCKTCILLGTFSTQYFPAFFEKAKHQNSSAITSVTRNPENTSFLYRKVFEKKLQNLPLSN